MVDGTDRGAVAKVAGDDLRRGAHTLANIVMRNTVEAVAADLVAGVIGVGKAVEKGLRRQGVVERGIEDGHVPGVRHELGDGVIATQVVPIMQRGEAD